MNRRFGPPKVVSRLDYANSRARLFVILARSSRHPRPRVSGLASGTTKPSLPACTHILLAIHPSRTRVAETDCEMDGPHAAQPEITTGRESGRDRRGLSRVLQNLARVRTMLKKSSDPRSRSASAAPAPNTKPQTAEAALPPATLSAAPPRSAPHESATRILRSQVDEERARILGERFGLSIKPNEWHAGEGHVLRVEKPVRVRIHRTCHLCQHTFGPGHECPNCRHRRCQQCARSPPKRSDQEKEESREKQEALAEKSRELDPIIPHCGFTEPLVLTRPRPRTGGENHVYKKTRMRIRRYCHQCDASFQPSSRICNKCGHTRCGDCERTPQKRTKHPAGHSDLPGEKSGRMCHECRQRFPQDAEDGAECAECAHPKCPACPPALPKTVRGPTAADLQLLHDQLEELDIH